MEATEKLCLRPFITPIHITEDNFGGVPRVYIETLKDHAVSIGCQREMYTKLLVSK